MTSGVQAGPSPEEMDTLLYCLGLNLAAQLPKDLKALLQEGEMDTVMKGLVDNMTGKCENANEMLQVNIRPRLVSPWCFYSR